MSSAKRPLRALLALLLIAGAPGPDASAAAARFRPTARSLPAARPGVFVSPTVPFLPGLPFLQGLPGQPAAPQTLTAIAPPAAASTMPAAMAALRQGQAAAAKTQDRRYGDQGRVELDSLYHGDSSKPALDFSAPLGGDSVRQTSLSPARVGESQDPVAQPPPPRRRWAIRRPLVIRARSCPPNLWMP